METQTAMIQVLGSLSFKLMVNDSMRTTKKPEADAPLLKKNRKGMWRTSTMTLREFADFIEKGGTWRPGINEVSNAAKDVESLGLIALDFDGKEGRERYTSFEDSIAMTYKTLSWSEENPNKERVVFVLSRPVNKEEYVRLVKGLMTQFKSADAACTDAIRFFFGSSQPVTRLKEVTLDVEKWLGRFPAEVKKSKKSAPSEGVPKKKAKHAKIEHLLSIFDSIEDDAEFVEKIFCLYDHQFQGRAVDSEDATYKAEGRNPFSKTDSTGTSFTVTVKKVDGVRTVLYHDRSKNHANEFNEGTGGTIQEYWQALHPDFQGPNAKYKVKGLGVFVKSFCRHMNVIAPPIFGVTSHITKVQKKLGKSLWWNELNREVMHKNDLMDLNNPKTCFADYIDEFKDYPTDYIHEVFRSAAQENCKNPFLDMVKRFSESHSPNLELWDNLPYYLFGIDRNHEDFSMFVDFTQKWFLAAYLRSIYPGMKYDSVLVLQGKQGIGKSSLITKIFTPEFSAEDLKPTNDRDNIMACHHKVVLVFSEFLLYISSLKIDAVKLFLTTTHDTYREPYAYKDQTFPRRFVCAATTNEVCSLPQDESGNRRYMPIPVQDTPWSAPGDASVAAMRKQLIGTLWSTVFTKAQEIINSGMAVDEIADRLILDKKHWAQARKLQSQNTPANIALDRLVEKLNEYIGTAQYTDNDKDIYWVPTSEVYKMLDVQSKSALTEAVGNMGVLGFTKKKLNRKYNGEQRTLMNFVISREGWHAIKRGSQEQAVEEVEATSSLIGDLSSLLGPAPKAPAPKAPAPKAPAPKAPAPSPAPAPKAPAPSPGSELFVPAPLPATAPLCQDHAFKVWVEGNLGNLKPEAQALETENAPDDEGASEPITISEEAIQQAPAPKKKLTLQERIAAAVAQTIKYQQPDQSINRSR
jgi:hypothetical protein